MNETVSRCGYIAIVGRPNVGKSTLLNHILGQKISITANKPQTTRHQILGIKTTAGKQFVYVDTPGLHQDIKKAMNRYMNRAAASVIRDVDIIVFVVEAGKWTGEDDFVASMLRDRQAPVIVVINKIDMIKDKDALLPYIESIRQKMGDVEIIPASAFEGTQVGAVESAIAEHLPEQPAFYPEEYVTDRSERFVAAEVIREKLVRNLQKELPYSTTVEIETYKYIEGVLHIDAIIWVERKSQKSIVIGKGGRTIKEMGRQARIELEKMNDCKVYLQLWVKVKEGWSDNDRMLKSLGYTE
jgi:GTP-binding protein Era